MVDDAYLLAPNVEIDTQDQSRRVTQAPQPGERIKLPNDMPRAQQQPWPPAPEVVRAEALSSPVKVMVVDVV